jgi:hypothetical protein
MTATHTPAVAEDMSTFETSVLHHIIDWAVDVFTGREKVRMSPHIVHAIHATAMDELHHRAALENEWRQWDPVVLGKLLAVPEDLHRLNHGPSAQEVLDHLHRVALTEHAAKKEQ